MQCEVFVSAMLHEHNVTLNWCRKFAANSATVLKVWRNFLHFTFRPWFSSSASYNATGSTFIMRFLFVSVL